MPGEAQVPTPRVFAARGFATNEKTIYSGRVSPANVVQAQTPVKNLKIQTIVLVNEKV